MDPKPCLACHAKSAPRKKSGYPVPTCLKEGAGVCQGADAADVNRFLLRIDQAVGKELREAIRAQQAFEKRSCDYQIAAHKGIAKLELQYGPTGPDSDEGSYLNLLHDWGRKLDGLVDRCREDDGCYRMLSVMRTKNPQLPNGKKFHVQQALKKACRIYHSRSAVPNNGPAWCDADGDCEESSCKIWWAKTHPKNPGKPWIDGENEKAYNVLRPACEEAGGTKAAGESDVNEGKPLVDLWDQKGQMAFVEANRKSLCTTQKMEGICQSGDGAMGGEVKCTMGDGHFCGKGRMVPGMSNDFKTEMVKSSGFGFDYYFGNTVVTHGGVHGAGGVGTTAGMAIAAGVTVNGAGAGGLHGGGGWFENLDVPRNIAGGKRALGEMFLVMLGQLAV